MRFPLASLCLLALVACGSGPTSEEGGSAGEGQVSRAELGQAWPLTVDSGVVACEGSNGVGSATFTSAGKTYALNGTAKGHGDGLDISAIWAPNAEVAGLKKDMSPLIDRALALCQ